MLVTGHWIPHWITLPDPDRARGESARRGGVESAVQPGEWGQIIPEATAVAAIVDRVTFIAAFIETGTDSYRLRAAKTRSRKKTA